jgi:dephospho-CoA kinase
MNVANDRKFPHEGRTALKVGITGGIGSGKSVVCRIFSCLGVPVFNADDAAKYVLNNNLTIRKRVSNILGENVFGSGLPDTKRIGQIIFSDPVKRRELETLLQPLAIEFGNAWMSNQQIPYVVKEAAVFFESGSEKYVDIMVGVYAPADVRLDRAIKRGQVSAERIKNIMSIQMNEEEKMSRCQYVILNNGHQALLPQVLTLHQQLLTLSAT